MTLRLAFYGRVSTEDQQDPRASRQWQKGRAQALIEPHGGVIVAEYFDIGQSRSLPWKRRPQASALLDAIADPGRGFEAVVIGEPQRAFYGNQFGLTFPVFTHYGVTLWVPEVGGPVDPGSDAHEIVMSLYGGMSKGERQRIKTRVRAAMSAQAKTEGRFLGGRPPYGYALVDAGAHPNAAKAADGKRMHRLERDPAAAPVVERIFTEYVSGKGLYAIAEGLTREGIPSPSAHDPARNRHRCGVAWSKSAVRAILSNPRYTGRQVWNRQRRDEVLLDVQDVALGHATKMRWNDRCDWVWSVEEVHEPLVSAELFAQARQQAGPGRHRPVFHSQPTARPYQLRGLVTCGVCGRKMAAQFNNGKPHYRCRYPAEYALANTVAHPKTVYVRESAIVPSLDEWLVQVFDPQNLDKTCEALAAASEVDDAAIARAEAARRKITDCDRRIAKCRELLDHDAPPEVVSGWIAEVQGERLAAERELSGTVTQEPMSKDEVAALIAALGDNLRKLAMLADADPAKKAALYQGLGLRLTYHPDRKVVSAEVDLSCAAGRVGGGT